MNTSVATVAVRFRLRELLEEEGISQSDLAKLADLSFATVNRLCTNATAQVSLETLHKLLTALESQGVKATLDDIIEREPEPKKRKK